MTPHTDLLHIAVVEDNDTLRDLLFSYLDQPDRRVFQADCGESLNGLLAHHRLDIVIMDLNLPHEDGLSIARRLRKSHPDTKIVMLTARVRSDGYDAGADVYLTKPTNISELEAVIRNLTGRSRDLARTAGYRLSRKSQILTSPDQQQVLLTLGESIILEQLALAPEQGLDAEFLLAQMRRHDTAPTSRENLAVAISRLRKKLETQLEAAPRIETVRNFGYRLSTPLTLL